MKASVDNCAYCNAEIKANRPRRLLPLQKNYYCCRDHFFAHKKAERNKRSANKKPWAKGSMNVTGFDF